MSMWHRSSPRWKRYARTMSQWYALSSKTNVIITNFLETLIATNLTKNTWTTCNSLERPTMEIYFKKSTSSKISRNKPLIRSIIAVRKKLADILRNHCLSASRLEFLWMTIFGFLFNFPDSQATSNQPFRERRWNQKLNGQGGRLGCFSDEIIILFYRFHFPNCPYNT